MTPPKISPLKFHLSGSSDNEPTKGLRFFPELNLQGVEGVNPITTLPAHRFRLTETQLDWSLPRLWKVKAPITSAAPIPASPPAAATQTGWSGAQVFKFITDTLLLIETLDAKGSDMISNGGEGGCRYEEMAQRSDVPKLLNKCLVKFEPDTHASVDVQLRKLQGSNTESLITIFRVRYDKNIYKDEFPDNQVRVQGFQFTPTPQKPLPFDVAVSPFAQMGYSIRYMVEPAGLLGIPLLGYPIFRLSAQPSEKLDLTKDFFQALGIDKPEYYTEVGTAFYKSPQTVRGFMKLMDHIESDDDKLQVVNINTLKGRPRLFDWLSFKKIDWVSRLREGSLVFPGLGSFTFTRKTAYEKMAQIADSNEKTKILDHTARLEIHGSQAKLDVAFENIELADAHFTVGNQEITLKGMRAGKIKTSIPGIKELIRQIKAGLFGLDKLHLEAEDLFVEEITIRDNKNGMTTHLKNSHLGKFILNGSADISALNLRTQSMDVENKKLKIGFHIENASIPDIHFSQTPHGNEGSISHIKSGNTRLDYSNTHLSASTSSFENLRWGENNQKSFLQIAELKSSGAIKYQAPSGISFETSGSSSLSKIEIGYEKSKDKKNNLTAQFTLAGLVNQMAVEQGENISIHLGKTQFNPSRIAVNLIIDPDSGNAFEGVRYDIDLNLQSTELNPSKIGAINVAPSSIKDGRIHLIQQSLGLWQLPQIDISGILNVHIKEIKGANESFNVPGLSISGAIQDIDLEGPAHFFTTSTGWTFEKPENPDPSKKLTAKAKLSNIDIDHDPHLIKGNDLARWAFNQVVKTHLNLGQATLSVGEIERIEFVTGTPENAIQLIKVHQIRADGIEASGVAWAKFPLFYYMRGVFPKIGSLYQDAQVKPSFMSLDHFGITQPKPGEHVSTFEGFNMEIYEMGGNAKFAKVQIPFLAISPEGENLIDTGNAVNQTDIYLVDKARGGYFRLLSVPRPLDSRRSRVVP